MIIVQKFHSIHDIDSEFIPNIEMLLQEEIPSFSTLVQRHDNAPEHFVFTYFLFFGPTQNTPIGFSQLELRPVPGNLYRPWYKRLFFWNTDHLHWKQLTWKIGDGNLGLSIFDQKYARSCKEKMNELIKDYDTRNDIVAQDIFTIDGLQDFKSGWKCEHKSTTTTFVLEPLLKDYKTYPEYLESLEYEIKSFIKESWKKLYQQNDIHLGDYTTSDELPSSLVVTNEMKQMWSELSVHILTFEKGSVVLGYITIIRGKNGNYFFEPFPCEPESQSLVNDDLYIQYALIKFFEISEAKKFHLIKSGSKLFFNEKEEINFFLTQGFKSRVLVRHFQSLLKMLSRHL